VFFNFKNKNFQKKKSKSFANQKDEETKNEETLCKTWHVGKLFVEMKIFY